MNERNSRSLLGFFILVPLILLLRDHAPGFPAYVITTSAVIAFWILHGVSLQASNLKNLLILVAFIICSRFLIALFLPETPTTGSMGVSLVSEFRPGSISSLKSSKQIAMVIERNSPPTPEERYLKLQSFSNTRNGLDYTEKKVDLSEPLFPRASQWVHQETLPIRLEQALRRIESWWREEFVYSLDPGTLNRKRPLDEFLFQKKKGFCEHYAASLTTLLKLFGFQARIATGYAGGFWNPLFKRLTYLDSDAHAWVEVLNPQTHQWQSVDPTLWVREAPLSAQPLETLFFSWSSILLLLATLVGAAAVSLTSESLIQHREQLSSQQLLEQLLQKVSHLESHHQLKSQGFTIAERLHQLTLITPDFATPIQTTLGMYREIFFKNRSDLQLSKEFKNSLKNW